MLELSEQPDIAADSAAQVNGLYERERATLRYNYGMVGGELRFCNQA